MRLNTKAKAFLTQEISKQADPLGWEIQKEIVLKRLDKLSVETGRPLSKEELAGQVSDMFPNFEDRALVKAAKLNMAKNWGLWLTLSGVLGAGIGGFIGLVWLVNLPYPMVRRPVARVAPMLLLPSYLNMDRNYREAIAHVEQADQLVNNATSGADIDLGAEKVRLAQANLDQLPVWFLGYEPVKVCQFMGGCSWRFTFDEFQRARAQVGRMEARVFQEKNALTALESAEIQIQTAKTNFQQGTDVQQKQTAIAHWQEGINQLELIPPQTLAGSQAKNKLRQSAQEFNQVAGAIVGGAQTQSMIGAAQQFANRANQMGMNGPLTVNQWQEALTLYEIAIQRLQAVTPQDPQYLASQTFLADYIQKQGQVKTRLAAEQASRYKLEQAEAMIQALLSDLPNGRDAQTRNQIKGQISQIIALLQKVEQGTTVYDDAQTLIQKAQQASDKL
jgi:tetratricopeptide (TPR) repeat protein